MATKKGNQGKKKRNKSSSSSKGEKGSKKLNKSVIQRKTSGLRKYNRIVKYLKGNKKVNIAEFREIQQKAKGIYPNFKDTPLSKIRKKAVQSSKEKSKKEEVQIKASQIPTSELELERDWWAIGEDMYNLHDSYPEVRLVIQSPQNQIIIEENEILEGSYSSSKLAEFVELLRVEFDDSSGMTFTGQATIDKKGKKEFAYFGTSGLPFPDEVAEVEKKLPPKVKKEIKKRKKLKEEKDKDKNIKKQDLKDIKKKELPKVKEKKERITDKQSEQLTKQLELVERLFDKGVLDKVELKTKMEEILSKYKKGGIV